MFICCIWIQNWTPSYSSEELWTAMSSEPEGGQGNFNGNTIKAQQRSFDTIKPISINLTRILPYANQELIHPPLEN